jgi:carbamoyltransferase
MQQIVLGLNTGEINASACLSVDGRIVAGAPEERFNRRKLTRDFPHGAVQYCLEQAGLTLSDVTAVAQGWNPGAGWVNFNPMISRHRIRREDYLYTTIDNLYQHGRRAPQAWTRVEAPAGSGMPPVYFVQHHRCHAANAFFLSPFDRAAIMTCDFRGEHECASWSIGSGADIELLRSETLPNSLGMFYATITELLGYRPDSDEWKVMALAAMSEDALGEEYLRRIRATYRLLDEGRLELDQSYFKGTLPELPHLYTEKLVALFDDRVGKPREVAETWHFAVAYAMQNAAEEIATHFLHHLYEITREPNLVVSGGFFMNSLLNGKILDVTPFERLYVPYAPTDAGNAIGAALFTHHRILGNPRAHGANASQIGPEFSDDDVERALVRRGLSYTKLDDPSLVTAELLANGHVVAFFQGRMEFGDRALGNRSILGDPRSETIKDKINSAVKYREYYRPFAPATLKERVSEIFEVDDDFTCDYMEKVVKIREAWRARIPGTTHYDGTGRVQTVDRETNPGFHAVISRFNDITGVPVVLNTSFNVNGEPIVLTPDDAISTFFNCGISHLVVNNFLVEK